MGSAEGTTWPATWPTPKGEIFPDSSSNKPAGPRKRSCKTLVKQIRPQMKSSRSTCRTSTPSKSTPPDSTRTSTITSDVSEACKPRGKTFWKLSATSMRKNGLAKTCSMFRHRTMRCFGLIWPTSCLTRSLFHSTPTRHSFLKCGKRLRKEDGSGLILIQKDTQYNRCRTTQTGTKLNSSRQRNKWKTQKGHMKF